MPHEVKGGKAHAKKAAIKIDDAEQKLEQDANDSGSKGRFVHKVRQVVAQQNIVRKFKSSVSPKPIEEELESHQAQEKVEENNVKDNSFSQSFIQAGNKVAE